MGTNEKGPVSIPECNISKTERYSDDNCFTKNDFEEGEQLRNLTKIEEAIDSILDGIKERHITIKSLLEINSIEDLKNKVGADFYTAQINRFTTIPKTEFEKLLMSFINALKIETDGQEIDEIELTGILGKFVNQIRTDSGIKEAIKEKIVPQVF